MKKQLILGLACLLFLLAGTVSMWGQTATTGQITGNVADPSGALVPGAKITLAGDNGVQRSATSDAAGHYVFALLPPGTYAMEISANGFAAAKFRGVAVRITETTPLDVALKLKGATEQTVEVTAAPPLVQSENATNGRVIEQATIRQLPLPTRNFQQLLTLTPGTTGSLANSSELGRGDAVVSVNGQRTTSNSIVINGIDSAAIGTGGTPNLAVPATDSMQEFVVQTSLFDATTGRNAGGTIAAVTKSGTNAIHGDAYGFFRDASLNANNFFLKRNHIARPTYDRKQFGGTLGGPIVKDKLWFFTSYQGTRETNGTSLTNSLSTVSVPGCLTNDRSDATLALLAAPTATGGCNLSLIPGLLGLNAVAKNILQAKLPNGNFLIPSAPSPTPGVKTAQAVTIPTTSKFQEDQFNTNLDYQVTASNRIYGKFFWADNPTLQGLYSFAGVQNALQAPGAATDLTLKNRVLSIGDMHVFSPTLINDFKAGANYITVDSIPQQPFTSAGWGIANPLAAQFPGAPTISISNAIDLNSSPLASNFSQNKTYTFNDMLTWTHGRHNLKFGGEFKHNESNLRFDAYNNGQMIYSSYELFFNGLPTLSLLGSGDRFRQISANDFSLFAQDDFRVNSRLTLNLGLRWDVYGPFTEAKGRFVAFDTRLATTAPLAPGSPFVAVTGGFVQAGNGNVPGIPKVQDGLVDRDWNNFGPRVGFAWKPLADTDKIVMRGGYGVYFDRLNARSFNSQVFNPPYYLIGLNLSNFTTVTVDPSNPYVQVPAMSTFPIAFNNTTYFPLGGPPFFLQVPYRSNIFLPAAMHLASVPVNGIYPDRANFRTPYIQQFSLGMQWEARKDLLLDVSYVGAVSRKLTRLRNINQSPAAGSVVGPYSIGLSGLISAPLGTFIQQTGASANYNSLQTSLTKRYSNGLQFLASYTWSHSIDTYSGSAVNDLTAVFGDTRKNYVASSDFDRKHRFVVSAVYDLPKFVKGGNVFAKRVVNDWEIASIGTWQSGTPFSIVTDASAFNNAYASLAAGRTVQSAVKNTATINRLDAYFDTTAFVPASGDFGNVPRNALRGPGQSNIDFSIVKFIPIREGQKFEFRTEFFNIFNHTNFANPVSVKGSAAAPNAQFGKILTTSTGPRVIQFAVKYNF